MSACLENVLQGDTLVYTEKGYAPICEVKVGDLVLSREEATGEAGYKKVEQISITETHTIHSIEVDGNTVIKTTAYHPFYVEGQGWVSAINLKEGDCLINPDGVLCVTKVEKERYEEPVNMYNFHVEDWVSYFVTELNIYVHNGGGLQSHHGLQQQWAKENLSKYGYDPDFTPTVTIETGKGMPHTSISNAQNARRNARVDDGKGNWGSSLQDELQNTANDFKQAGFSKETINQVMEKYIRFLGGRKIV